MNPSMLASNLLNSSMSSGKKLHFLFYFFIKFLYFFLFEKNHILIYIYLFNFFLSLFIFFFFRAALAAYGSSRLGVKSEL